MPSRKCNHTRVCEGCGRDAAPRRDYCHECDPDHRHRNERTSDGELREYLDKYHGASDDPDYMRDDI